MPSLPLPAKRPTNTQVGTLISAFESETLGVLVRTSPRNDNLIFYCLIAMMVLGLIFIAIFPIDIVVTGTGVTVAQDGSIFVDPLDKGVVRSVLVKNGDIVKKDQVLATLDPTITTSDVAKDQQTIDTTQEELARLQAEQNKTPYAPPGTTSYQKLQLTQYQQRQAQYKSNVANFDAQIAAQQATLDQYQQDVSTYNQRFKANVAMEDMQQKLESSGWGSRLKTLEANDTRLEIQRLLAFSQSQIPVIKQTIAQYQAQRDAFITQWYADIAQWISNDRTTIEQTEQNLIQDKLHNQLINITAPVDAYVLKLGRVSPGYVVGSGLPDTGPDPMFTLVPMIHPLLIEDDISTQDIGFVKVGDTVNIKLDAYNFIYYGTMKGVVTSISQNYFTTDVNNTPISPYFKVLVEIKDTHLKDVPNPYLVPGMTLSGDILVGSRTILQYATENTISMVSDSMREP